MEQNLNSISTLPKRNISLDILKILSMVMVIILHTKTYGLENAGIIPYSPVYWVVWTLHMFSLTAVNCFVFISGYFTSSSEMQPKKLLKLWVQTFLISTGIYLFYCVLPNHSDTFGFGQFAFHLFPIMSNIYWFFTCYFVLMILSPFINKFINSLNQEEFKKLLFVLLLIFMIFPSFNVFGDNFDSSNGYSTVWFIVLYFVGAYVKRYPFPKKHYEIFYVAISLLSVFLIALLESLENTLPLFVQMKESLYRYNSITVFSASFFLFLFFINKPVYTDKKWGKLITTASASSFCVYLIHEHPFVRSFIWGDAARLYETTDSLGSYLLRMLITVTTILVIGIICGFILNSVISFLEKVIIKFKNK